MSAGPVRGWIAGCAALVVAAWLVAPRGPLAGAQRPSVLEGAPSTEPVRVDGSARAVPRSPAPAPHPPEAGAGRGLPVDHASGDDPGQRYEFVQEEGVLRRVAARPGTDGTRNPFGAGDWGRGPER